jgi:hypothetical protein
MATNISVPSPSFINSINANSCCGLSIGVISSAATNTTMKDDHDINCNIAITKVADNVREQDDLAIIRDRSSPTLNISRARKSRPSAIGSLQSVRFTSYPCRPLLSMQRNEEFNVITWEAQEFNIGRCARNMFSEIRNGSV